MTSNKESGMEPERQNPYSDFGLDSGASFDEVKKAKEKLLAEAGEDAILKAKIELAYDALLMNSLKERQLGKISAEAISASKMENTNIKFGSGIGSSLLNKIQGLNQKTTNSNPEDYSLLSIPDGSALYVRIALALLSIVIVLASPNSNPEAILSLSTVALLISQVRRGRSFLISIIWSLCLLSIGLIVGSIISNFGSSPMTYQGYFSSEQIKALPALLILWLGTLLLG